MAIQYAGGSIIQATSTPGSRTAMVDFIEAQLVLAGWSSSGSSGDYTMTTATTPQSLSIKMRVWDPGSGNCARLALHNISGSINLDADNPIFVFPNGSTYTIIANKYQFFLFVDTGFAARTFAAGGVPYVPSFLEASFSESLGWLQGNATTDSDAVADTSFRWGVEFQGTGNHHEVIDEAGDGDGGADDWSSRLVAMVDGGVDVTVPVQFWNGDWLVYEPLLMMNSSGLAKGVGQLWDCAVTTEDGIVLDDEFTFDSRTFHVVGIIITGQATDGGLLVAVT